MAQSKFTVYKVVTITYTQNVYAEDKNDAVQVAQAFGFDLSEPYDFEEYFGVEAE